MSYKLIKKVPKTRYYEVYINADSNDGDYISRTEKCSQKRFDEIVNELINMRDNYGKSHEFEDYPNSMDLDIPYSDWGCCHTLEDLTVTMYDVDGYVYNVEF